jgi:DNA-binding FadR family transcriptional regulator
MKADDLDRYQAIKVDLEFHDLLAAATHNPFFTLVSRPITELLYSIYIDLVGTHINSRCHRRKRR